MPESKTDTVVPSTKPKKTLLVPSSMQKEKAVASSSKRRLDSAIDINLNDRPTIEIMDSDDEVCIMFFSLSISFNETQSPPKRESESPILLPPDLQSPSKQRTQTQVRRSYPRSVDLFDALNRTRQHQHHRLPEANKSAHCRLRVIHLYRKGRATVTRPRTNQVHLMVNKRTLNRI